MKTLVFERFFPLQFRLSNLGREPQAKVIQEDLLMIRGKSRVYKDLSVLQRVDVLR